MQIYLVGGAVRDKLLNMPNYERDYVVVGSTPEEMIARGFKKVGKDFPVFLEPETHEEYALARTERKKGRGYYGFEIFSSPNVTLEQDLERRDLTINAMAEDLDGKIIDPFHGQKDLEQKILRHVSNAFSEDPVRILRVARFASRFAPLGFTIAPETLELMREMVLNGEVDELVPERVWQEMERSLGENDPVQFFLVLRKCGALERIWPSLNKLWGIPQPIEHHPEVDTGVHTMMSLNMAVKLSDDKEVRFATLCHDLGKGETDPNNWPRQIGHEELGVPLIKAFSKKYHIPNPYRDLAIMVSSYHLHCHRIDELKASTILKTLEALDAFRKPERFKKFLLACEADARGRLGREERVYPQAQKMWNCFEAAREVDIETLISAGFSGEILGSRIHQERVSAIKKLLAENKN